MTDAAYCERCGSNVPCGSLTFEAFECEDYSCPLMAAPQMQKACEAAFYDWLAEITYGSALGG